MFSFIFLPFASDADEAESNGLRISILSAMNREQTDSFYNLLNVPDIEVRTHFRPKTLFETDVVVYFVTSWEAVLNLPGADFFPKGFSEVSKASSEVYRQILDLKVKDNETSNIFKLKILFYSTSSLKINDINCYADDILSFLRKKEFSILESNYCGKSLLD